MVAGIRNKSFIRLPRGESRDASEVEFGDGFHMESK